MTQVVIYVAPGCHLCEPATVTTRRVCQRLSVPLDVIDISRDPQLEARYRLSIPVVEIDGQRAFSFYVDEAILEHKLGRPGPHKLGVL